MPFISSKPVFPRITAVPRLIAVPPPRPSRVQCDPEKLISDYSSSEN